MGKISLSEFWYPENYSAVRCKSRKEAEIFINGCIDIGKKSFSLEYMPYYFGEKTPECLDMLEQHKDEVDEICFTNEGCFSDYNFYKNRGFNMYEFEDICFNQSEEDIIINDIVELLKQYDCDLAGSCAKQIYNKFIKRGN